MSSSSDCRAGRPLLRIAHLRDVRSASNAAASGPLPYGFAAGAGSGAADELVERLALRARRPLLRAARLRVARARRIAERDDRLHRAAADPLRDVRFLDAVRARDDAVVPGGEHHVLHAAADVETARLADDRDDELRGA